MQPEYQEDEIEIDLKELIFELLEHWKMIVLSTVLVAAIAFLLSKFLMTPQYESTSQLFVLSKSTSITSVADIQAGTSLTNDYLVVAKDRPVVDQVISNLGLKENYESLSAKLTVTNPADSRILKITVTDESSKRAKMIADEMADVVAAYIAAKMDQDPPSVISYGYADGDAVSPNIVKNTIIGGLIGLLLAIAIVLVAYLLNDTIMTPEDIEKRMEIHVLGTLPMEESEDDGEYSKSGRSGKKNKKKDKKTQKSDKRQTGKGVQ